MFVKVTKSGPRRYVQLVESYRDDAGRVKKRTVATLGRLDQLRDGALESVISGLLKVSGQERKPQAPPPPSQITFESARALGDVWALTELWNELGLGELRQVFRRGRHRIDVEALVRIMVLNRLCDPESKLGVLRWLETVALPGLDTEAITHQQLLRAMDALRTHADALDEVVARLLRPLIDQDLSVVFYDLTTIGVAGHTELAADVRAYGRSKDGPIARQFVLGVVQTAEGLPIHHQVFEGNVSESATLLPTLTTVLGRFPTVRRVIVVADRGLLSLDNLESLEAVRLASGAPLEFIIAVPARRYGEFAELLGPLHAEQCIDAEQPVSGELRWQGRRLVWHHDPVMATALTERRRAELEALEQRASALAEKLNAQDAGHRDKGRALSDGGATARFYHEVRDARLAHIVRVDLKAEYFAYELNHQALANAEIADGKLLLVTNAEGLDAETVIARYKALADIERGFRVLNSELAIGPVYHRLPERIRAHAAVCFLALVLHRVMRLRLKAADAATSPERALERLRRIQYHRIRVNDGAPIAGLTSIDASQGALLSALNVTKPTASKQLSLL